MNEATFLFDIGVALILAKVLGYGFERFKQPAVMGEILAGILIGQYFLGYIIKEIIGAPALYPFDFSSEDFVDVAHLGIIFLLFITGLETNVGSIKSTGKVAVYSTIGGVIVPLLMGFILGELLGYGLRVSLVIGVLLTATSIGITARTMMDLGVMRTDVGVTSLSSSIMDDIIGLVLIVLVTGSGSLLNISVNIAIFFLIVLIAFRFIDKLMILGDKVHTAKALVSISLGICFILSAIAEHTLSAAIEGAFFAGLLISRTVQSRRIIEDIKSIGYAVFIPLFFVYIGTIVNLGAFLKPEVIILSICIVTVAIVSKVTGRGIGAIMAGYSRKKSLQLGIGSVPRMEVALVSMAIAVRVGAIGSDISDTFIAATFVFVTVTTLITPPLLKWSFRDEIEAAGT